MRISFDIGGVISRYPKQMKMLIWALLQSCIDVYVVTDMPWPTARELLNSNGFDCIDDDHLKSADWNTHGDRCKAMLLKQLAIDIHFDDYPAYCVTDCDTIGMFVWPVPSKPFSAPGWKTKPGNPQ
jgi:hypothetical protein